MRCLSFILVALLFAGHANADVVVLGNGDRLTGTVDSLSGGRLLLVTDYAGHVPIKIDAISELMTEAAFAVVTSAGKVDGRFAMLDGDQVLVTGEVNRPLALSTIVSAGQNKLSLNRLALEWSTHADLAAVLSNGNTDTEKYSALIESTLKKDAFEHNVRLLVSSEKAEDVTTRDEFDLDYLYKRFISQKWYASGNAEYFEDPLKDVDSRITLGAGIGYQFWDDSFGNLSTDVGISYVREDLDGNVETNPAIRWGLEYKRYLLSKKLEAFHKQSVLFIPDSDRGQVLESSTGLRYALNSRIDATARVDVDHDTKPAPGNSKTDVTYNLGVGVRF